MPDFPHRGPNISRITVEGTGGFIYALTPILILLFGAPRLLLAWLCIGAALAPLAYWRHHSPERSLTHLTFGLSGLMFGVLALFVVTTDLRVRLFALVCVVGGVIGALL